MTTQNRQDRLVERCRSLKEADQDLVDVIQFGSSIYAPDLARDIDLLVTTRAKKDEDLYWDIFSDLDLGVDVLVRTPEQPIGRDIAANIMLLGNVLFGNGETIKTAEVFMEVPTYERARKSLRTADTNLISAQQTKDPILRDEYYRVAFDRLFDASRYAAMAYLHTTNSRWGQLRHALPSPFNEKFRGLINKLHIQYSYDGNYPQADPDGAFAQGRLEVEKFIADLENLQVTTQP